MNTADPQTAGTVALRWPLVGRGEELGSLRSARRAVPPRSVVIAGGSGVGKSRLVAEALREANAEPGWTTLSIVTSSGLNSLPFGPLRAAVDARPQEPGLAALAASIDLAVDDYRGDRRLLIGVDEVDLLDDDSADLLGQWVERGHVALLVSVRDGSAAPAALSFLDRDDLVDRIEVGVLSREETAGLVQAALGPEVEQTTLERLWVTTQGNPLYLREIIAASVETGALRQVGGQWRWRGEWAQSARVQEIVAERLGRLEADELNVLETLAVGGTVPVELLDEFELKDVVDRLEERGLVIVTGEPGDPRLTIAHPVHAEVLKSNIPVLQARSICRNLADAAARRSSSHPSDQIRMARWSIEAGISVDPVSLRRAADATLWHIGEAMADRIQQLVPGVDSAARPTVSAEGGDRELVISLFTEAWEADRTVAAGATLAVALVWTGLIAEAEEVLATVASRATDSDDRLRVAIALAHVRFWGQYRTEDALSALESVLSEHSDPVLAAQMFEARAGIELNIGHPEAAVALARQAAEAQGVDLALSMAAPPAAAGLSMLGRCGESLALIDEALPAAILDGERPLASAQLMLARIAAFGRLGRTQEALELAEVCRRLAIDINSLDGAAIYGIVAGDAFLLQGRPASASRRFRDAAGLLAERDVLGYQPWALAGLARARAAYGDLESAGEALAAAETASVLPRYFDGRLHMARVEVAAASGRINDAVAAANAAADWGASTGMVVDEALALDVRARLAPDTATATRLEALVARTDSPLVANLAMLNRAVVTRDAAAVTRCAKDLAEMRLMLRAAEAAAMASRLLTDRREPRQAQAAAQEALRWYEECENARSLMVESVLAPGGLTMREFEVARLAVEGGSHKEIAHRLQISVRTVDAHLYRAYAKLGVADRSSLGAALSR